MLASTEYEAPVTYILRWLKRPKGLRSKTYYRLASEYSMCIDHATQNMFGYCHRRASSLIMAKEKQGWVPSRPGYMDHASVV